MADSRPAASSVTPTRPRLPGTSSQKAGRKSTSRGSCGSAQLDDARAEAGGDRAEEAAEADRAELLPGELGGEGEAEHEQHPALHPQRHALHEADARPDEHEPDGGADPADLSTRRLVRVAAGTRSRAVAMSRPRAKRPSCARPYVSRAEPACMCPAASSDIPLTTRAPGSRTASGGRTVRSGPSSSPALAAPKTASDTVKAARVGSRARDELVAGGQLDEGQDDEGAHRGGGDIGPAGLEDQRDADGEHRPGERDEPGRAGRRGGVRRRRGRRGRRRRCSSPVDELVADEADARRLVQAQAGRGAAVGGRAARGEGDHEAGRADGGLHVGEAQAGAHLGELLLDLLHRLAGRDHRRAELGQQGAGLGLAIPLGLHGRHHVSGGGRGCGGRKLAGGASRGRARAEERSTGAPAPADRRDVQ